MKYKVSKISQILVAMAMIAGIGMSSCEKFAIVPVKINPVDTVHFQVDIQPIFSAKCLSCHGVIKAPDLRDGKSFAALTKLGYINPPDSTCTLYTTMIGADHSPRTSDTEKQKVLIWLKQGAHNN
jgi:hypothetical protein